MFKQLLKVLAPVAALLFSSVSSAGLIVDTVYQTHKVNAFGSYSYVHNLNDEPGFALGSAIDGTLQINLYDDQSCSRRRGCRPDFWLESALVVVEAFDFDTGGLDLFATGFYGDIEVQALAALNADGLLNITVKSSFPFFGDFYVGDSIATIITDDGAAQVPEPSVVTLIGIGLLGLGLARRFKKA